MFPLSHSFDTTLCATRIRVMPSDPVNVALPTDTDPETGLATRRRWLAELAGTGVWCAASHIDGWGTIEAAGDGYRWQPAG